MANVYFNVIISNGEVGRIVFKLYDDIVPITASNFRRLSSTKINKGYRGTWFHRVIPEFLVQGGDFTNRDGTGGRSIYGGKFADENFVVKHDKPGLLSMANSGPNTNGSQFMITLIPTPWLDGKHVVFGEVIEGMDFVKKIGSYGTGSGELIHDVIIYASGTV